MDFNGYENIYNLDFRTCNLNETQVDMAISSVLSVVSGGGNTHGKLWLAGNAQPSATGIANAATLENTYFWDVTYS